MVKRFFRRKHQEVKWVLLGALLGMVVAMLVGAWALQSWVLVPRDVLMQGEGGVPSVGAMLL